MTSPPLRPIPTLAQWLGDGERAGQFEEWVRCMLSAEHNATNPTEAQTARLLRVLAIACTEGLRIEAALGADVAQATVLLARLCGVTAMSATICALADNAPLLKIARILTEEFAAGAQQAARAGIGERHG